MSANLSLAKEMFRSKRGDLPITQVNRRSLNRSVMLPKKTAAEGGILSGRSLGLGVSATSDAPSADEFDPDWMPWA